MLAAHDRNARRTAARSRVLAYPPWHVARLSCFNLKDKCVSHPTPHLGGRGKASYRLESRRDLAVFHGMGLPLRRCPALVYGTHLVWLVVH
eukprot:3874821-Prymnesium_polylepis.1